jgi:hypothetical protein
MGNGPMLGASTLTNFPLAVPVANPLGNAATRSIYDKYSSLLPNDCNTLGVSPPSAVFVDVVVTVLLADSDDDSLNDNDEDEDTAIVAGRLIDPSANADVVVVVVDSVSATTMTTTSSNDLGKEDECIMLFAPVQIAKRKRDWCFVLFTFIC